MIHDADECHDETIVQLHSGHVVRVPHPLDEVLAWFAQRLPMKPLYAARVSDLGPADGVSDT